MSDEEVARCVALRRQGTSFRRIAFEVNYGVSTIRENLAKHAPEFAAMRQWRAQEAIRLHMCGMSGAEIARRVGYSDRHSVYRVLARARKEEAHG